MRGREKDYSTFHSNVRIVGFKEEEEEKTEKEEGGDGNKVRFFFNQDRKGSRVYTKKPDSEAWISAQRR